MRAKIFLFPPDYEPHDNNFVFNVEQLTAPKVVLEHKEKTRSRSVIGQRLSVPRYLTGNPRCWNRVKAEETKNILLYVATGRVTGLIDVRTGRGRALRNEKQVNYDKAVKIYQILSSVAEQENKVLSFRFGVLFSIATWSKKRMTVHESVLFYDENIYKNFSDLGYLFSDRFMNRRKDAYDIVTRYCNERYGAKAKCILAYNRDTCQNLPPGLYSETTDKAVLVDTNMEYRSVRMSSFT